jgi:hypothetical protein
MTRTRTSRCTARHGACRFGLARPCLKGCWQRSAAAAMARVAYTWAVAMAGRSLGQALPDRCLRQRFRGGLRVGYWLRLGLRFRRRQWPRLRLGFRRQRWRHWRWNWWWHWGWLHRLGPRRLRLLGLLTGTIWGHPEMIPSRALRPPGGGRPVSASCALTCAWARRRVRLGDCRSPTGQPSRCGFASLLLQRHLACR